MSTFRSTLSDTKPSPVSRSEKVIEALNKGFPVTIDGSEYVMLERIYRRTPVYRGIDPNAPPAEYAVIEVPGNISQFMRYIDTAMSDQEFLALSSMMATNEQSQHRSQPFRITDLVIAAYNDMRQARNFILEIDHGYTKDNHRIDFASPVHAVVRPGQDCWISSDDLYSSKTGINEIDTSWPVRIVDDAEGADQVDYIFGPTLKLTGKVREAHFRFQPRTPTPEPNQHTEETLSL